jgi:hypothetical protein
MLQLTEGSDRLLPEIFPQIPHIGRLNLTTAAAGNILDAADTHLGAMAVPYVLAIHEDYLKTCLTLLERGGMRLSKSPDDLKLAAQHAEIQRVTGQTFTTASLEQLHILRSMRNCTIHSGGRADSALVNKLAAWSADAEAGWVKLTKRSPGTLTVGDTVTFSHGEVVIALAVTKVLALEATGFLGTALPKDLWADLLVEEMVAETPSILSAPDALRRASGRARFYYGPLMLGASDITRAIARRGASV